jgi:hypothetical protein
MEGVIDYVSCFETLEEKFTELKAQNATMLSQQNNIIELLKLKLPDYLTPTQKNDSKLRPAMPNNFDRDRSKGRNFIHSCDLYVKLIPHQSDNSNHKAIHWAISYMKLGRAALFTQRLLVLLRLDQKLTHKPKLVVCDNQLDQLILGKGQLIWSSTRLK